MLFVILGILLAIQTTLSAPGDHNLTWYAHPEMSTGKIMFQSNAAAPNFSAASIPLSFNITYSNSLTTAKSAGIGIVGFDTEITNDFAVNISIASFTTTTCRITMQAYGDTVLFFYAINFIVTGNINFAEVQFQCFLCSNINIGYGLRSDFRNGSTFFVGYNSLQVSVYLSGFRLSNPIGLKNYLSASASIPSGSNTINYAFSTDQNNTISQICYTTIIYCSECIEDYLDYPRMSYSVFSNQSAPSPVFTFPSGNIPNYKYYDRMFYGVSIFQLSRAIHRYFNFQTLPSGSLTNFVTNYGTYSVRVDGFWSARRYCNQTQPYPWFNVDDMSCQQNCSVTYLYESTTNRYCKGCYFTCWSCNGALSTQCTQCRSGYFRELNGNSSGSCVCISGYVDIGQLLCYPCITFMAGCNTCISQTICQTCFPGFVLNASGLCQCTSGHLVSGVCTNITGCIALVSYSGNNYCTTCNAALNFETNSNFTCSCMAGYYFNGYSLCSPKCGDSKQASQQECDDGNTNDGDGCSSSCIIEDNWMCVNGSVTSPSICYVDMAFDLSVAYVRRVESANQMEVALQITPVIPQLSQINFQKFMTTDVPNTGYKATYSDNGLVTILYNYNQTIQGNTYSVEITLDPNYFHNTILSTSIPASAMNAKLTYDSYNQINYPMKIVVIILDCVAIIVMFLSCISERMIGIEMIQTIQIVLFTQTVMKATPSSFMPLQMLRYASGYNEVAGIDYTRTYTFGFSLSAVGLQKEFLLSYNLMYGILMAVCLICISLKAKQLFHENKVGKFLQPSDQRKNQEKWSQTTKVFNFVFERILFLVAFMCMFLIVFALMLQLTDMHAKYSMVSKQFNLLGSIVAISIIVTMICGVILNGFFPGTLLFPMLMKQYYPPVYFLYQAAFIFLLAFDYTQQYILYILQGMSFLFLLFNLAYRPYPQRFHTFVLAFHQVFIMGVIGIYIFENLTTPKENEVMYKIVNIVIVGLLFVIVGLNTYRLYRYYKFLNLNGWDQYGNPQNFYEGDGFDFTDYKNLLTPKDANARSFRRENQQNMEVGKKKGKVPDLELEEMKRASKDKKKAKSGAEDDSTIKWNYNQMVDEDVLGINSSRYPATIRDVKPDVPKEQELNVKKGFNEAKPNQQNLDNENTIKDLDSRMRGKNEGETPNDNQNVFDNPYDEKGYTKSSNSGRKGKKEEEDPLKIAKMRLKHDFESKLKASTLKQV